MTKGNHQMKRSLIFATLANSAILSAAFDTGKPGWKLDENGAIVMENGNPVYINAQGQEQTVDGGTISRLNGEAKNHRTRAEAAEEKLKAYDGIDPEKAREALETVSKLDQKKLIDAGEIDKVREEVAKGFTTKIADLEKTVNDLRGTNESMTRNHAFATSKFVAEKIAVPPEMFQATFGNNFKFEDGKLVPYDANGNKIYSPKRHGEVANFEEALEVLVDGYAHKDAILKGGNHSGSGNNGNGGSNGPKRTIKRADFETKAPHEQASLAQSAAKGEIQIVD
jgi:ribosomal protein L15